MSYVILFFGGSEYLGRKYNSFNFFEIMISIFVNLSGSG